MWDYGSYLYNLITHFFTFILVKLVEWNIINHKLEKWFPLLGEQALSLYFWSFQKQNREEEGTEQKQQTYQLTQGYNILHGLQLNH